jgi:adenosine deaminase
MPNILLCTLGASWAVIPEAYAFLAPERLPLYHNHPEQAQLLALKDRYQLQPPDEIWICTTQGKQTQASLRACVYSHQGKGTVAERNRCQAVRTID